VPDYTSTEIIQLRCLVDCPGRRESNDGSVILGMITTGDPGFWEIRYKARRVFQRPGLAQFLVPRAGHRHRFNPGAVRPVGRSSALDGRRGQLGLTLTKSGGNIDWVVDFIEQGASIGYVYGPVSAGGYTVAGASVGKAQRIQTATDGGHMDVTLGHIVVRKDARDTALHVKQLNAWAGEIVGERLNRLRDESGLWYVQLDPPPPYYPIISDTMGPQPPGTLLDLYPGLRDHRRRALVGRGRAGPDLHHQALPGEPGACAHPRRGARRGRLAVPAGPR
jgi:hypothetical protein